MTVHFSQEVLDTMEGYSVVLSASCHLIAHQDVLDSEAIALLGERCRLFESGGFPHIVGHCEAAGLIRQDRLARVSKESR